MRAQDANRRRLPTADVSRDVPNQRPLSLGNPRNNLNAPPLPIRGMMQSASVCDLSTQHLWNPGIQQVIIYICISMNLFMRIICINNSIKFSLSSRHNPSRNFDQEKCQ